MITEKQVNDYVQDVQKATDAYFARNFPSLKPDVISVGSKGKRYYKIVRNNVDHNGNKLAGGGVHCFIDVDGNIWKAASYKAPQKNGIRGHITNDKRPLLAGDFYVR